MRTTIIAPVAKAPFSFKLVMLLMVLLSTASFALAQQGGLAERRAVAAYQQEIFPEQVRAVQAAAGFEVPVEVQWDTLALAGQADNVKEPWYITDVFFSPLVGALKKVAIDDMGKSALKAKLKKIVITHDAATAPGSNYPEGVKFEDGVLTLNFEPGVNGFTDQIEPRAKAIQGLLESKL